MRATANQGLTLLELVLVVAILTVLAVMVTPSVNDAITRTRVGRTTADLRTISLAVELYTVDNGTLPMPAVERVTDAARGTVVEWMPYARGLTTPIAYLTSNPPDPFADPARPHAPIQFERAGRVAVEGIECILCIPVPADSVGTTSLAGTAWPVWVCNEFATPRPWVAYSLGPDGVRGMSFGEWVRDSRYHLDDRYDPTNGVKSPGNILRFSGGEVFP